MTPVQQHRKADVPTAADPASSARLRADHTSSTQDGITMITNIPSQEGVLARSTRTTAIRTISAHAVPRTADAKSP